VKPRSSAPSSPISTPHGGFRKRLGAGFGCPACGYQGWNAFVATGLTADRRAKAWFWCPSCRNEFALLRPAWIWLGFRVFFIQIIGFAILYAIVMLVQRQGVPWIFLIGVSALALCILFVFTMVLRSPAAYQRKQQDPS
jgi:hypothetical protein